MGPWAQNWKKINQSKTLFPGIGFWKDSGGVLDENAQRSVAPTWHQNGAKMSQESSPEGAQRRKNGAKMMPRWGQIPSQGGGTPWDRGPKIAKKFEK